MTVFGPGRNAGNVDKMRGICHKQYIKSIGY